MAELNDLVFNRRARPAEKMPALPWASVQIV
jgi:hypothetical protein